jgi:hypothetical protein
MRELEGGEPVLDVLPRIETLAAPYRPRNGSHDRAAPTDVTPTVRYDPGVRIPLVQETQLMKTPTWAARMGIGLAFVGVTTGVVVASAPVHIDLEEHYEALVEAYDAAERAYYKELLAAEPAEQLKLFANHPWKEHLPRFLELVELGEGTDVAGQALVTIFSNGMDQTPDEAWFAFDVLINDYIESEMLAGFAGTLRYRGGDERVLAGLRKMTSDSPHANVRAAAHFNLAVLLMPDKATRAEARKHFDTVIEKYADVQGGLGETYATMASASLFELDNLQIGQKAPDFASTDEVGAAFNLSDYEGKVVLVDFWGFW